MADKRKVLNFAEVRLKGLRPPVEVPIQALGGEVLHIKHLSSLQRDQYERSVVDSQGKLDLAKVEGARARYVSMCVVDPDTLQPIASGDDWAQLDADVISEINREAQRVNGMLAEDVEAAGKT